MKKLSKLTIAFLVLTAAAFFVVIGGLLTMHGLHLPGNTMVPDIILVCLFMIGPLMLLTIASLILTTTPTVIMGRPRKGMGALPINRRKP